MEDEFRPSPGQVLLGKYEVEDILGQGGMGLVVRARHLRMGHRVALKFLQPHLAAHPVVVERFRREAQASVSIRSEHVARVLDVEELEEGVPLMVMELLDGVDLATELDRVGKFSPDRAAALLLQACEAVAEAHALGIVHRDLKPANLFLTHRADGSELIKVMDFGIAKALQETTDKVGLTDTQDIVGSPLYMPPEQIRSSRDVDVRADIWALGVILYELVSGDVPFIGSSSSAVLAAVAADQPRPLSDADAPLELRAVIEKALQKDREHRHSSIAEFAAELGSLAPHESRISVERVIKVIHGSRATPQSLRTTEVAGTIPMSTRGDPHRVPSREPAPDAPPGLASVEGKAALRRPAWQLGFVAGGVLLLVALSLAATGFWRRDPTTKEQDAAALEDAEGRAAIADDERAVGPARVDEQPAASAPGADGAKPPGTDGAKPQAEPRSGHGTTAETESSSGPRDTPKSAPAAAVGAAGVRPVTHESTSTQSTSTARPPSPASPSPKAVPQSPTSADSEPRQNAGSPPDLLDLATESRK